jgi:phage gp29-like protein
MKNKYLSPKSAAGNNDRIETAGQFATRERANDFVRLMRTLPDPDPILRKMGRGITALRELLADSHLESVWSVRCSTISGAEWFAHAGGDSAKEKEAAEVFTSALSALDMPRIIEEIMEAVAFGFSPLEILWTLDNSRWGIADIVGKPQQWFEFDSENHLVFKTGAAAVEELPENRFLIARHRPSYANPYGVKVFSKCYWPVTFKKNGFRWWTVFVEKYGGAFLYGKYPSNAGEQYKKELLDALQAMIADAVAIAPEGAEINIESLANKGSVNNVHKEYIDAANAEISKAVLGQTLTTEIGDKGSFAAAKAHDLVRGDLAAADRRRVSAAFDRLAALWSFYNFGADVAPPRFDFVRDEDLQADRAERDVKLYAVGWRPKKSYITREYEIPEEDFDIAETPEAAAQGFALRAAPRECGGTNKNEDTKKSFFKKLFASKSEKQHAKDLKLMNEFAGIMSEDGQDALDKEIEKYVDALGMAETFDDARKTLRAAYSESNYENFARIIDEVRFAAQGIGGAHVRR